MSKKGFADEKACRTVLAYLQQKPDAAAFLEPVDWEGLGLPDYPDVVKKPMDLGTIESKLNKGQYNSAHQFAEDVRLVWANAKSYNRADSAIYQTADALSKLFEKKMSKFQSAQAAGAPASKGGDKSATKRKRAGAPEASGREVTRNDRIKFSQMVNQLSSEQLGVMVAMIQRKCPSALNEEDDDELEIEISSIDGPTLLDLNAYCQEAISSSGATKKRKR